MVDNDEASFGLVEHIGDYILEHYREGKNLFAFWENKYAVYDPDRSSFYLPKNLCVKSNFEKLKLKLIETFNSNIEYYTQHKYDVSKIDLIDLGERKIIEENIDVDRVVEHLNSIREDDLPKNLEFRMIYVTYPPFAMLQPFSFSMKKIYVNYNDDVFSVEKDQDDEGGVFWSSTRSRRPYRSTNSET